MRTLLILLLMTVAASAAGRYGTTAAVSRLDVALREGGTLKMASTFDLESFKWQVDVNTVVHVVP